jgi:murein DD-endopeptidase MepM/ murein hydrolase activator NlpD
MSEWISAERHNSMFSQRLLISLGFVTLLLAACSTQYPETCPSSTPIGLIAADEIASDDSLPFRFPLGESTIDETLFYGWFGVDNQCPPDIVDCYEDPVRQYHAAEDYRRPAGTPVYAMADGRMSFSGPAGGYGWLIIIDHPQANLYSLYGHLSPSRWKLEAGTEVKRGDLIAYLGNPDENGGSVEEPLEPHLHFGIRAGQSVDYPGRGEWRFMAGWIRLCPQDLGWLQPSLIITSQKISTGGYPQPKVAFLTRWGLELFISGIYTIGGAGMLVYAIRKKSRFFMIFLGIIAIAAGIVFRSNGMVSTYTLLVIGILILAVGIYHYIRRLNLKPLDQS